MKLKHVALVVCIILSLSFIRHIDSACSSEIVYPLLYGPGTWDLFINDIASFSAGDILIGGKSFSTKAAGEGFVMRIDKYGKIFWQKIYQSSATGEDSIDKVAVSNDYSFAVGHSLTGSANTYFLLKLGSDGSVLYNAQVGGLSTLVGTDSIITNLVPVSDSSANVYYDGTVGGVHYVSGSYVVMDGTTAESVMGLKNVAVSSILRGVPTSATAQIIFSVYGGKLFLLNYDSANTFGATIKIATNDISNLQSAIGAGDIDLKSDSTEAWVAVISSDPFIYGFHAVISGSVLDIAFKIGGFSSIPTYVNVLYVDSTHCIILAIGSDNTAVIIKADQSTAASPTIIKKTVPGFTNGKIIGYKLTTGFLMASSIIGGESASYSKSQGIVFKPGDDIAFSTYNCYEVSTTITLTVAQYVYSTVLVSGFGMFSYASNILTGSISYAAGTPSNIQSSTGIEIRAQSTKDNTAGTSKCKLQPVTLSYSASSYAVTASATDVSLLSGVQCQNAPLTYTATVTGEASLPTWVQNTPSIPILNIRPSQVKSTTYLKTNTVSVTASDKNAVPQTATASLAATFTNSVPTIANTLPNQIMYKGMGAYTISIPSNTFTDDDRISMSVSNNLLGITPTTYSLSENTLSVKMPDSYTGNFSVIVTDTDYVGQTKSTSFNITVSKCIQTGCDNCLSIGPSQCTKCLDCYVLLAGACLYNKTTCANYTAPTYLTREVEATSPAGVGAPVAAVTAASIGVSAATGASPVVAGLGISQCQSIQALSMFNMNTPDNYVSYSQGYEVTKLNFKFINGIGLQDSLSKSSRRNLSTGYKSLSNIGFGSGNFFVNYIYFFLILMIMVIVHLVLSIVLLCCNKNSQSKCNRCLRWTKRGFEFSWYLHLFIFASLFIFILTLNDMAGKDTSTGLNIFSFILSIIFFILMIVLMVFPIFLLCKKESKLSEILKAPERQTICQKLTYNYMKGLKVKRCARLYNFIFIFRRLILAILIICTDKKATQLIVYIVSNVIFTIYMIVVRPFNSKVQNLIGLFNEFILLVCCFLMFAFFAEGSAKTSVGILMIVLFSINIIICFSVSFAFEIYLLFSKRKNDTIKVFKDGEVVQYKNTRMVEEEGNTKNEVELKGQKLDMQPNASIIQPIMQPYALNEEMKVEVQEDRIDNL